MCNKLVLLVISAIMLLALVACGRPQPETVIESPPVEGPVDMPNPIAVYCTGLGYEYTTRERKIDKPEPQPEPPAEPTPETLEGPQPGMPVVPDYIFEVVCVFPDGSECEEWEFMSGRCGQEHSYCVQQGYTLEPGENGAICVFTDGSSCLETEFFNGDCGPWEQQGNTNCHFKDREFMGALRNTVQPNRYKVIRFEDDGSLLLTVVRPGEGMSTFRLHPDGTLEQLSEATLVGVSQQ